MTLQIDFDALGKLWKNTAPVPPARNSIEITFVPVDKLDADRRYQRQISQSSLSRIRKIIANFSWSRFGALIIARQGERFVVIDGQHRSVAARALDIIEAPAIVVNGDLIQQAGDFVGINTTRTSVATIDKFRARVTSGDPAAIEVAEILANLEISTDVAAGHALAHRDTRAVAGLEKLVKRIGKGEVFTTLEMLLDAQPGQRNLLTAFAIETTAMTLHRVIAAGGDIDRLDVVLQDTDFESLKNDATHMVKLTGGQIRQRGHELLLRAFNKGRRQPII